MLWGMARRGESASGDNSRSRGGKKKRAKERERESRAERKIEKETLPNMMSV